MPFRVYLVNKDQVKKEEGACMKQKRLRAGVQDRSRKACCDKYREFLQSRLNASRNADEVIELTKAIEATSKGKQVTVKWLTEET